MAVSDSQREPGDRSALTKVPEITAYFWIVKILTTGAGESISDFLSAKFHLLAAAAAGLVLALSLVLQFRMRGYSAWTYWFAVVMVAIFGTMAADVMHGGMHVSYLASTVFFAVALAVIFALWYRREKTLSIHSIFTRRREGFYWATVIATFALGTAAGDMTATTFGWGYFVSAIMFGAAIALVGIIYALVARGSSSDAGRGATRAVFMFWFAYILTRPLGASIADWLGKSPATGGLGFGDGTVGASLMVVICILVAYLALSRKDVGAAASVESTERGVERGDVLGASVGGRT